MADDKKIGVSEGVKIGFGIFIVLPLLLIGGGVILLMVLAFIGAAIK